jgi:hypothetical protein
MTQDGYVGDTSGTALIRSRPGESLNIDCEVPNIAPKICYTQACLTT